MPIRREVPTKANPFDGVAMIYCLSSEMPFHHGLVRIGTLAALRIARTGDVIHVSHVQRASILAPLNGDVS